MDTRPDRWCVELFWGTPAADRSPADATENIQRGSWDSETLLSGPYLLMLNPFLLTNSFEIKMMGPLQLLSLRPVPTDSKAPHQSSVLMDSTSHVKLVLMPNISFLWSSEVSLSSAAPALPDAVTALV